MMRLCSVFSIHRPLATLSTVSSNSPVASLCISLAYSSSPVLLLLVQSISKSFAIMKLFAVMFVAVVLADTFMSVPCAEAGKSSVDIINDSVGEPLWVHCKSGDDDLQWQLLQIGQDYHFEFHENIIMNTVFWCRFVWGPNGKNWQAFTVWDRAHPWDMPLPCGNCGWRAQTQGMFIWDKWHQTYDLWKVWNTNGPRTFANETNPPGTWEMPALDASQRESK